MSVTPKMHCIEDHAINLLRLTRGMGDIGEDAGERAHQEEARNERRIWAVRGL